MPLKLAPQKEKKTLWALLLAALAVRLALAFITPGYEYDMNCFFAWGLHMAQTGPANFYADGYFCDYPPAYMLVLGWVGRVMTRFDLNYLEKLSGLLLALPVIAADLCSALTVYQIGRRGPHPQTALRVAGFAAFCPVLLYDTGIWKQIDGFFALPVLLCFWMLTERRYLWAALCYGAALAIKPQALLVGPVLAVCFLQPLLEPCANRLRTLASGLLGAALACAPVLGMGALFGFSPAALLDKYFTTAGSYPYATINAFNGMAALGGNWKDQTLPLGPLSWQQWGTLNLVLLTVFFLWLAFRAHRAGRFCPLTLAAFYAVGVFTVAHQMHERYLVFGVLLVVAAAARWGDRRLLGAGLGLSVTALFNLAQVYSLVGTDDEWLSSATARLFTRGCGLAETVCFGVLAFAVWDILVRGRTEPIRAAQSRGSEPPAPQPRWTRRELGALAALTLGTAAVSLTYLGELTAPQTVCDAVDGSVSLSVTAPTAAGLWVYSGVPAYEPGSLTVTDRDGNELLAVTLDYNSTYKWESYDFSAMGAAGAYTVTLRGGRVVELCLRDTAGEPVPEQDFALAALPEGSPAAFLFDEQALVPEQISQLNSTYFDEIYHGRTGYEMLHGMEVYETTHPPLGKDFIMLGIALFGMTGFGWRVMGTLFGVAMVPVFWLFIRRLTRRPWLGALGGALLALDFMRFAQSRIATIDVYSAFFVLLAAYFMVWYCQSVLTAGVHHSLLPMFLCGLSFGLGCASKWTAIYAGAGLAVLYFAVLVVRYRQAPPHFWEEALLALFGGVGFFVVLPLGIYLASYLPYWLRDPEFTVQQWWLCQKHMYSYHSTLKATHPFESRWYTWPFVLRPVWYYSNGQLPAGSYGSIAGFGNPVVWWGGAAALMSLCRRQLCDRESRPGGALLVFFAAQLLPWVLVTRCTFLYHYFGAMVFALAALLLELGSWEQKAPKTARRAGLALLAAAAVLFVWFYPALSGLPVSAAWAASLKWLPSWGFYILP